MSGSAIDIYIDDSWERWCGCCTKFVDEEDSRSLGLRNFVRFGMPLVDQSIGGLSCFVLSCSTLSYDGSVYV